MSKPSKSSNKLGLLGATSYVAGTIIGSGILVSPQGILENTRSVGMSLIAWCVAGVLAAINALVYIELGSSIPESGSEFSYIMYVGWKPLAFSLLWVSTVVKGSAACGICMQTFGQYVVVAAEPFFVMDDACRWNVKAYSGYALLALFTFINFFSLKKYAARIQIVTCIAKVLTLSVIIATGFYYLVFMGYTDNFQPDQLFNGPSGEFELPTAGQFALALYAAQWALGGYDMLNYGTEEIQIEDKKILPRAVMGGVALATAIHLLGNFAYFVVFTPADVLATSTVATSFVSRTLPASVSAAMPTIVALLMCGSLNSDLFQWSRFMLAGSRRGMLPSCCALVAKSCASPRVALTIHAILSVLVSHYFDVDQLLNFNAVTFILQMAGAVAALVLIKWRSIPVAANAIKFPLSLSVAVLALCAVLVAVPVVEDTLATIGSLLLCVFFWLMYYVFYAREKQFTCLRIADDAVTSFCAGLFRSELDETPEFQKEQIEDVQPRA